MLIVVARARLARISHRAHPQSEKKNNSFLLLRTSALMANMWV